MKRLQALGSGVAAAALAFAGLGAAAVLGTGQASGATAASSALSNQWYAAAPYLMPTDNNPPDATAIMDATGLKAFQLAFILAPNGGGCSPTWGGTSAVSSDTAVGGVISAIRAKGGDVSVSIGGYGGTKLGQACSDASSTAAAYQQVITKYQLHAIDFDLEEPEYENTAAVAHEIGAAKILQQNNPGLFVSVTTAGTAAGTGWFGQQMLNEAKSQGFTPNNFSIMPFDGGFNGAASQTAALTAFNGLLKTTFGWDTATAYAHEGFSGMNGRSDSGEYFYQADFQTVLDYATSHGMGRFTFWSLNRDRQCNPPDNGTTSGVCSSVPQSSWEFAKYSVKFAGATPPSTPPPTTPPTSPPGGTCTVGEWTASAVYVGGNEVAHNGHKWKAKWWTTNEEPGTTGEWGVWQDEGAC
ncbi:carbohydrate-binding protein [Streptomyces cocklensis]|uniref:Chitinase n=1 Tax=Actinacidiphila cocklensis TaxID=887465 RepID=A0A9W4DQU0_9ACTN|nr:carbohydrate-binding protein [Actinacidiphila cocklensis]MDD1059031.1 carbohydrate-binding protein [Actinacidiphila cocklensis]WSX73448.1 carbohydrate-binding protein [Streptomyces sp. NBC_00899]WSX80487.1 carbohydrate-binding protein [Streptomyces sp. NBC_00899]CAG6394541.1 Chitinase [Actinacidiphila cocklensis]